MKPEPGQSLMSRAMDLRVNRYWGDALDAMVLRRRIARRRAATGLMVAAAVAGGALVLAAVGLTVFLLGR